MKRKIKRKSGSKSRKTKRRSRGSIWKSASLGIRFRFKSRKGFLKKLNLKKAPYAWAIPALMMTLVVGIFLRPNTRIPIMVTSARLQELFHKAQAKTAHSQDVMGEKIAFWSQELLRDPKLLAVLGRGPKINDSAPLFPAHYDCTTYVETVGALARSEHSEELGNEVIKIRYKNGVVGYFTRNHFPEADWIPNNQDAGVLKDITETVAQKAGLKVAIMQKTINKTAWFKTQKLRIEDRSIATSTGLQKNEVNLNYISLDDAMAAVKHMPQGALVNVVRENKANKPVLISHQGLVVWKKGKAYFRHAAREKEITEIPMDAYIASLGKMPWKVVGFNINQFQ